MFRVQGNRSYGWKGVCNVVGDTQLRAVCPRVNENIYGKLKKRVPVCPRVNEKVKLKGHTRHDGYRYND